MDSVIWMILTPANNSLLSIGQQWNMTGVEQRSFDPPPFPHQAVNKSLLWARA